MRKFINPDDSITYDPLTKSEIKDDNEVDALAGATITGNGLSAMIKESVNLYKSYLESIRAKN